MSTTLYYSEPINNLLYSDEEITITTARIEVEGASYVAKYISSVKLHEENPTRKHGLLGLVVCAIGSLFLLIYLYIGKISVGVYVVIYLILVILSIMITLYLILAPAVYKLELSLINGQSLTILRSNLSQMNEIHAAIKDAIAYTRMERAAPMQSAAIYAEPVVTTNTFS